MQLDTFSNLVPSGSQPGKICWLAKVHTSKTCFVNDRTAEYNLAKYLVIIINDAMPTICMLDSTGSFVNQISSFYFEPSRVSVGHDVVSLFSNIPLNEAIDIVGSYAYQQHSPRRHLKSSFKLLLEVIFSIEENYDVKLTE